MADEWDDDEFGTFESASVPSTKTLPDIEVTTSPKQLSTPAWILAASPPTPVEGNEHEQLSSDQVQTKKHGSHVDVHGSGDGLAVMSLRSDSISEGANGTNVRLVSETTTDNATEPPTPTNGAAMKLMTAGDQPNTCLVTELQTKLDTALTMREHCELSSAEDRRRFLSQIDDLKRELASCADNHEEEMRRMRLLHEKEMKELNDQCAQVGELVTRQCAATCEVMMREQRVELEKVTCEVTRKCVQLLDQQDEAVTCKLNDEAAKQRESFRQSACELESDLRNTVTSLTSDAQSKCAAASEDVEKYLKDAIAAEIDAHRDVTTRQHKELAQQLHDTFQKRMEEMVEEERGRREESVRAACESARESVLRSCQLRDRQAEIARGRHLAAIEMLLSASQEHLRQMRNDFATNDDHS